MIMYDMNMVKIMMLLGGGGGTSTQYANITNYTSGSEPIGFDGENLYARMVNDAFHGKKEMFMFTKNPSKKRNGFMIC